MIIISYILSATDRQKEVYDKRTEHIKSNKHSDMIRLLSLVVFRNYQYIETYTALSYVKVTCETSDVQGYRKVMLQLLRGSYRKS